LLRFPRFVGYICARMTETLDITIRKLGASGDGIADGMVYVAGALPNERVRVARTGKDRARLVEVLEPAPERVAPPCKLFGACGGCSVQHMSDAAYAAWKTGLAATALAARGFDLALAPLLRIAPGTRRRAELAAWRGPNGIEIGFHKAHSDAIVDLGECHVLEAPIVALVGKLRTLLNEHLRGNEALDLHLTRCDNGFDLVLTGRTLDTRKRMAFADFAVANQIVRVTWRSDAGATAEIVALHESPHVTFGTVQVVPPPGAFLQAARPAEAAIVAEIAASVGRAKRVIDLFAGLGTFGFPLTGRVHAVEGDFAAVAAMQDAARASFRAGRFTAEARDLERRPFMPEELEPFDAAIFDPPREGAAEQAKWLAQSDVPTIVAVSCNPTTFARDARILVDGGYTLTRVVPVDQFLWTSHLELVAVFKKPKQRRR
jgi:23S rRNA (uracil1939-C5)-methyltransferase